MTSIIHQPICPPSRYRLPPSHRPSFTLVELLVAIAIMGVLVGMVVFSLAGAATDAKIARTRATISKINSVVLQEWEAFRYRAARIDIDPELLRPQTQLGGQPALSPREGARLRMIVLRDLMRMEMPDRLTDILYPPTGYKAALFTTSTTMSHQPYYAGNSLQQAATPSGSRMVSGKLNSYRAKLNVAFKTLGVPLVATPFVSPFSGGVFASPTLNSIPQPQRDTLFEHQPAEMLYQIVATAIYEGGSALEAFRPTEIGDVDGDGLPEFLDAWGTPIRWIRWPSGFGMPNFDANGNPQPHPLNTPYNPQSNSGNADAMDPLRSDWRWVNGNYAVKPWLLVPLIVSAGPDQVFDLTFDRVDQSNNPLAYAAQTWSTNTAHSQGGPYYYPDPYFGSYAEDNSGTYTGLGLGSFLDVDKDGDGASDNITNYSLILE